MTWLVLKFGISAALVVLISEVAKRSTVLGAVIASLPITSLLGMLWLYIDTSDKAKTATLAADVFWAVLPSLLFFLVFPLLIRWDFGFYLAFFLATLPTIAGYLAIVKWVLV